jgi:hypothetical protein
MSWSTFKSNILNKANSPESIDSIDFVANLWATEYDKAIKAGKDLLHMVSIENGNVDVMENLFKISLSQGQASNSPTFSLVTEFGKGVQAYWTGAIMKQYPIPMIPAPGSIKNIAVVSNLVTSPGVWTPQPPISPNDNTALIVDQFILAATIHLTTIAGVVQTTSLYPAVPSPLPAPGILAWTGYTVSPSAPGAILAAIPFEDKSIADVYSELDYRETGLDKNDPEVQEIVNPNDDLIDEKVDAWDNVIDDEDAAGATQMNNIKAEQIDKEAYKQGLIEVEDTDTELTSGYKSLDELLKIAGKKARVLGKNARVKYTNLKSGYKKGIHGLCPQGTQAVVVALTGVTALGKLSGNADWFSFKNPSTGGGRNSFAVSIGGKSYYNDKVKVGLSNYINNPSAWQVGDIIVMGYTGKRLYGHIQVWTGWKWVSDFSQNKIQTNHVDFSTVALWRLNETGKAAVSKQKTA